MRLHLLGIEAMVSLMASFRPEPDGADTVLLRLTLGEDGFNPRRLAIPAGRRAVLVLHNVGNGPAEIASPVLRVGGVVAAGHAASVPLRPLQPGESVVLDHVARPTSQAVLVATAG